jgi:putative DNA methylase
MSYPIKSPRKLIEVALPLDAINEACAYEKMPGIGAHPRGIHLWWARRPLAAARAVLFAQLVNDPGTNVGRGFKYGMNKKEAAEERKRLFKIIQDLVRWENSTNEEVLEHARAEISRSWREVCLLNKDHPQADQLFNPDKLPSLHDPFAGGGAIPLEAQRLGLQTYASDLNPVAVLINTAMIDLPARFCGRSPVGPLPEDRQRLTLSHRWEGVSGLAEDVRRYGEQMRNEAERRVGRLYPPVEITAEVAQGRTDLQPLVGRRIGVVAWIWARTVRSPSPAFREVEVPLISSYLLAKKEGKEVYLQPVVEDRHYHFLVKHGTPPPGAEHGTKVGGRGANFRCIVSTAVIGAEYIKAEGMAGRIGQRLIAIVAQGEHGRVFLPATEEQEIAAKSAAPGDAVQSIHVPIANDPRNLWCAFYGLTHFDYLFTPRQLVALATLSDLLAETRKRIRQDALDARMNDDAKGLEAGGTGATAYAEAVSVYLAFAIDRCADFSNSLTRWVPGNEKVMNLFARQAIPMTWDFPEAAILANTVGGFLPASRYIADCMEKIVPSVGGVVAQADAQTQKLSGGKIISTDPPYYDNITYADLSDFFYVWLRRGLRSVFPTLLATITTPKTEELIATPYRHNSQQDAERFFLDGMTRALSNLAQQAHPECPITIYYAFKQSASNGGDGTSSTGWETFLTAVVRSGFAIVGTWPLRSEQEFRMISMGTNALASCVLLVCRRRATNAPTVSRRDFIRELNAVLPEALDQMTRGAGGELSPVAAVDLSQAIIGPGMGVFSKYSSVLEADGSPMGVRTALQLINRFLAEDDFDADTQFCLHWFEQHGWGEGPFGDADTLSRGKGTSVDGMQGAGVLLSGGGKVRLLKWAEYPNDWDPQADKRTPVWEALHQLIRALRQGGESATGALLAVIGEKADGVRQLAYRLYTLCERLGQAEDARPYNELITSWTGIESAANLTPKPADEQGLLF